MPTGRSPLFLAILLLISAAGPFSMQIFLPALPAIQQDFSVDPGTAQLTLSLSMISIAFSTLLFGPLSDRFGRRPVVIAGMTIFLAGSIVATVAPDIETLIGARIFQAAGSASGMVLARSIIRDVFGAERSARYISYLVMAMVVAPMLAPALGGILNDEFGGWRTIFGFVSVVSLLVLVLVIFSLAESHGPDARRATSESGESGLPALIKNPRFWGYALQSSLHISVFFAFISATPYLMTQVLNRPSSEFGLYFVAVPGAFAVGTFLSTRLLDRYGIDRLIIVGTLSVAALIVVTFLLFYAYGLSVYTLFLPAYAIAFMQGPVISNAQAGAINVDARFAGTASGLTGFLQMFLSAGATQLVGSAIDGTPWPMMWVMAGLMAFAVLFLPLSRPLASPDPA